MTGVTGTLLAAALVSTARLGTVAGEAVLVVTDVPVVVVSAVCRSRVRLALDG